MLYGAKKRAHKCTVADKKFSLEGIYQIERVYEELL
jgi:hypothetical protein